MTVLQNDKLLIYDEYTFHRLIYASAFSTGICDTITISRLLSASLSNPEKLISSWQPV